MRFGQIIQFLRPNLMDGRLQLYDQMGGWETALVMHISFAFNKLVILLWHFYNFSRLQNKLLSYLFSIVFQMGYLYIPCVLSSTRLLLYTLYKYSFPVSLACVLGKDIIQ